MRLNKFIAHATGQSRRQADDKIQSGRVEVDGQLASLGQSVTDNSVVRLDGHRLRLPTTVTIVMLNKPTGYVSSRRAQAQSTKTLYDLLPSKFKSLKTVGRLDKDTAGLILLTDDGDLAFQMTHPKFAKTKVYQVGLDKPLSAEHRRQINCHQVKLSDGLSGFQLVSQDTAQRRWRLTMQEGRNRQIRRTFAALGYTVTSLERTNFANYTLGRLKTGHWQIVPKS